MDEVKRNRIKQTLAETRQRRKSQQAKVCVAKIQNLNNQQKEAINKSFVEAKWLVNDILSFSNIGSNKISDYEISSKVRHLDKDKHEIISEFEFIGSQVKQSLKQELISNLKTLRSLKKKGHKVGRLKFRKEVKSLDYKQLNITYLINDRHHIHLQGVKGKIRVNGLSKLFNRKGKIKKSVEIANAKLIKKADGLYFAVTYFIRKEVSSLKAKKLGLDFGCSTALTTSEGRKFNIVIEESERLKRLQKKKSRQIKSSNNYNKTKKLIDIEYQKLTNKKEDRANQIVASLTKEHEIFMQDEQLSNWHKSGHGKAVQHSILGRLKFKFIQKGAHVLSKWAPTTKTCSACGHINPKLELNQRTFICEKCHAEIDRDINAAINMIQIGQELTKFKPVEKSTSNSRISEIKCISEKQERACTTLQSINFIEEAVIL